MAGAGSSPSARAHVAFAILAIGFATTIVWAVARELGAEWRRTEARFHALDRQFRPAATGEVARGLQQVWLPDLHRADRCVTCHRGIDDPAFATAPEPFRAHPGRWLDTHPGERFGCTACHGGQGNATTFADAAHAPRPHWPTPMWRGALIEAGCGTCHRERRPEAAPALAAGRDLIARSGCAGCHEIPGFDAAEIEAPALDSVGHKLRRAWLERYLERPGELPGARMPDFRLTRDEVRSLAAYLRTQRRTPPLESGLVDWSRADPDRGRELFARARCVTCHRVDERGGTVGPDLSSVGSRVSREWLWSYLADPHRDQPDTLMPRFRFAPDDLRDLAEHIARDLVEPAPSDASAPAKAEPERADAALVEQGRRTFVRRGCFGCHRLEGTTSLPRVGPSLAGIGDRPVERADFLGQTVVPTLPNWLLLKLRAPDRMSAATSLMPTYALDEAAQATLVVALLSLTSRALPASRITVDPPVSHSSPQGAFGAIVSSYRCLSCHELGGAGGHLSTVALDRIGSQLQPHYLRRYLLEPATVRVHLEARMPRMNVTEREAETVVDFASRALIDDRLEQWNEPPGDAAGRGRHLYETLGCAACHGIEGQGGYVGPDLSATGRRLKPGWVRAWLLAPEAWKPGTLQPDYGMSPADADALTAYLMRLTGRPPAPPGGARTGPRRPGRAGARR